MSRPGASSDPVPSSAPTAHASGGHAPAGGTDTAAGALPWPRSWTPEARRSLATQFNATLQRGVPGLCFSPYLEGQQPGDQIPEAQIRERLQIIRPHTGWVRSFSCTDGHVPVPLRGIKLANRHVHFLGEPYLY